MPERKSLLYIRNEQGISNLLVTLLIMPIMLFMCFAIVPFFVYMIKLDHLHTISNHALKEAEAVGYMNATVMANTNTRMAALGLGSITINGTTYPSYSGSTEATVYRDDINPTVRVVIKYPAPNLTKMLSAVGGNGDSAVSQGYYYIVLHGKSEVFR